MGQKTHPIGFRLGIIKTWSSRWYEEKNYAKWLHEDIHLREFVKEKLAQAGISKIEIERAANKLKIDIYTSRPGIIIGRKGTEVDKLKQEIQKKTNREVFINIQEIQKPELDAQLIGESVAMQLEKRVAFRRAMRKAVESALRFGARGIILSGGPESTTEADAPCAALSSNCCVRCAGCCCAIRSRSRRSPTSPSGSRP